MGVLLNQRADVIKRFNVTDEYIDTLMTLCKQRLGINSNVKDMSIEARVLAAILSLADTREIRVDANSAEQLMLMVDLAAWAYGNVQNPGPMPVDLRYRLNTVFMRDRTVRK